MNQLLIAEMFDGDREALRVMQQSFQPADLPVDMPRFAMPTDSRELMPGAPPHAANEFDLIRI
jgi:hypothetical protein